MTREPNAETLLLDQTAVGRVDVRHDADAVWDSPIDIYSAASLRTARRPPHLCQEVLQGLSVRQLVRRGRGWGWLGFGGSSGIWLCHEVSETWRLQYFIVPVVETRGLQLIWGVGCLEARPAEMQRTPSAPALLLPKSVDARSSKLVAEMESDNGFFALEEPCLDPKSLIDPKLLFVGPKIGEGAHAKVYEGK
ncbi:hypothetical protein BHM03_00049063 [Ensete ventricosum]|nr:hypothetical protein BHM03_00049063 [Ensete ventricosum]